MATKHMNAAPGDFAATVLMPGDPLRAQYIADTYLDDVRRVTDVRNMWGFTGSYKGQAVSVMAHGMGIPSVSIYCTELITEYDVKRVIRVGSCGTSHPDVKLRDIIIAMGASTDSNCNRMRFGGYDYAALASYRAGEESGRRRDEEQGALSRRQYFFGGPVLHAGPGHVRDHGEIQCVRR